MINTVSQRQIQSIYSETTVTTASVGGKNLPPTDTQAYSAPASVTTDFKTSESLSTLANKYDVRNMSPREMSEMSQNLYKGGVISFQDHALLSFQPELGDNSFGPNSQADTPKDFIAHWERQLHIHEQLGQFC